jgi:hypothetical protein
VLQGTWSPADGPPGAPACRWPCYLSRRLLNEAARGSVRQAITGTGACAELARPWPAVRAMRRGKAILAVAIAATLAVALTAALLLSRHNTDGVSPAATRPPSPGSEPTAARAAVRLLLSPRGRSALTPELNAVLPAGKPFPTGTTFTQSRGTWQQAGAYANVTGIMREPGHVPSRAEIGLVKRRGHWLVTFEAAR